MSPWKLRFCRLVLRLDRIPRYGRLYPWDGPGGVRERIDARFEGRPVPKRVTNWRYMRHGRWGMNLLDHMGLLWPISTPRSRASLLTRTSPYGRIMDIGAAREALNA